MKTAMTRQILIVLSAALLCSTCGVDGLLFDQATEKGPDWVPDDYDPYTVKGQVYGLPLSTVEFYAAGGFLLSAYSATTDSAGIFATEFPGSTEYRNLVVSVSSGGTRVLGLAVRVPKNPDIYYDPQSPDYGMAHYHLGGLTPALWRKDLPDAQKKAEVNRVMSNLDDRTTTVTLSMLANAHMNGKTLGAVSLDSTNKALDKLADDLELYKTGPVWQLHEQVQRILAYSARSRWYPPCFVYPDPSGVFLNPDFLEEAGMDYTGDGLPDMTTGAFAETLKEAALTFELLPCEATDRKTVVFQLDLNEGKLDRNCSPVSTFKEAKKGEGKKVYIVGGMKVDPPGIITPLCSGGDGELDCLTEEEWTEINLALGNSGTWNPNVVPMRDDGQAGDAVANDNIWTLVFDFPYIPTDTGVVDPATGQTIRRKGVRIGYKYTFGHGGDGWGGTEEWPGNHRLLELEDVNKDGLVVRYDYFGDETSNKGNDNLNAGLCEGRTNPWPEEVAPGCFFDVWENKIDTDGDCTLDSYASSGPVVPACAESNIAPIAYIKSGWPLSATAPVIKVAVVASPAVPDEAKPEGGNSGGFLTMLLGADFKPSPGMWLQVNTPGTDSTVSNNSVAGFLALDPQRLLFTAPPFPAKEAKIAVGIFKQGEGEDGELTPLGASGTWPLVYTAAGDAGCSLVYPARMGLTGDGAVPVGEPTAPVLLRVALADPAFTPGVQVELGVSPPCCKEEGPCPAGVSACDKTPYPTYEAGWNWSQMALDGECAVPADSDPDLECGLGESQFAASLVPDMAGVQYRFLGRYSVDYGQSWHFCGVDEELSDGQYASEKAFSMALTGQMETE